MLRDVLGEAGLSGFAEIALVLFLVAFLLIVVRVLRRGPGRYDEARRLPLEDDRVLTPRGKGGSSDDAEAAADAQDRTSSQREREVQ